MKTIRITPIVIAAGAVLAAAARVYVIGRTDMTVGTLFHDTSLICNLLYYGIIILTMLGAVISSGLDEKRGVCGGPDATPGIKGVIAIGFGLLITALCCGYDGFVENNSLSPSLFVLITDLGAAVILGVIAFVTLYKKEFSPGLGFVYVLGGAYYVCRGINCFMIRMAITTIPEYLVDCLTVICGAVFFVSFAKLMSGNGGKLTVKAFFAFGSAAFVISVSSFLGAAASKVLLSPEISQRIVFTANEAENNFQALHGIDAYLMAFPPLPNLAVGIFAAVAMIAVCFADGSRS